jgi:nucleotide-binding universal stress UspA family protein
MKIICATDFSERARAAARIAVDLARRTAGSVELIHVIPPRGGDPRALPADAGVPDDQQHRDGHARLAEQCRALSPSDVSVTSCLAEGDVEASILARARASGADLIVMGAHAHPALERLVLGSVAERMARRAELPVLIVPPGTAAAGAGNNGAAQLRVMLAHDGRAASDGALDFVRSLRQRVACEITVLRLYWPLEEFQRLGLQGARPLTTADPDVVADLDRSVRQQVGVLPGWGRTVFVVEPVWGEPAARILDAAAACASDLVVMGAESRKGLARLAHPAVASSVARHAHGVPIVFVPAPARQASPGAGEAASTLGSIAPDVAQNARHPELGGPAPRKGAP